MENDRTNADFKDNYRRLIMKSVTTVSSVGTALVMGLLLVTLFGCEEGPVERAGENVDEAIDKAGDQIEKSGDDIQDAVNDDKR